jgi:hypothetical protein
VQDNNFFDFSWIDLDQKGVRQQRPPPLVWQKILTAGMLAKKPVGLLASCLRFVITVTDVES